MKCIYCGNTESKVLDSRANEEANSIRRRRECLSCGKRFTTYETVETTPLLIIKSDESRQSYNREKLKRGIIRACEKRPVTMAQITELVQEIEKVLYNSLEEEIPSSRIGELVMDGLKKLDEVSYIRFASVYRKFADLTHFIEFIQEYDNKK